MGRPKKITQQTSYRTWLNASNIPSKGEKNNSDSETLPDQNLTVRQLLANYTSGVGLPQSRDGYYSEDQVIPKWSDLTDKTNSQEYLYQQIEEVKAKIAAETAAKEKEALLQNQKTTLEKDGEL
jgi:hypothetical protein